MKVKQTATGSFIVETTGLTNDCVKKLAESLTNSLTLKKRNIILENWQETGVLDLVATPGEKIVLALILESRLQELRGFNGKYQKYYRRTISDLHDHHYAHCMRVSAKISDEFILKSVKS